MRALVTGATGFVGAHVARSLRARGVQVRIWRRHTSKLDALEGVAFEDCAGDLLDPEALAEACDGCEWVFHIAAVAEYWRVPIEQMYRVNVEGTQSVLEAARRAGVARVVFTSSGGAVGQPADGTLADESHPFNFPPALFSYGHSKWLAEEAARAAGAVIVNPSVVLGPGDLNRISGDLIIRVAKRQMPMMPSGGFGIIDVRDAAAAHIAAAERGHSGERYILNAHNVMTRDLIRMAAEVAGVPPPRLAVPRALIPPAAALVDGLRRLGVPVPISGGQLKMSADTVFFDASKARRELGLETRPLRETVRDTWAWYKEAGFL